jgi:hypothetical protein
MHTPHVLAAVPGLALLGAHANAQNFSIPWHTIDCGGGTSAGASFTLTGTIGQHDAGGPRTGGGFSLSGGFWAADIGEPCIGDFNNDGSVNTLDVISFLNAWAAGDTAADINGDGAVNTLDVLAFLNAWADGC